MGEEKRGSKRIPVNFDLFYRVDKPIEVCMSVGGEERFASMNDVSEGGMAIVTDLPLAEATELNISFHLIFRERQTPPMPATGRVRYSIFVPEQKRYRLGIEFIKVDEETKQAIRDFIKHREFMVDEGQGGVS